MATALVTRPREDAEAVSRELRRRGLDVVVEPLLDIVPVDADVDASGVQGILATSANGIRALARVLPDRALPVWAVGDASARVARELGYQAVESAGGDVESLAELVKSRCRPEKGAFLHAAGSVTAGDLSGRLGEAGIQVRRVVLYKAETAAALSPTLAEALNGNHIDVALFFSPRTAATFANLLRAAGLDGTTAQATAYALSPAVARELTVLPWAAMVVAAAPTQAALLAALDDTIGRGSPRDDPRIPMTQADDTPSLSPEPAPEPAPEPEEKGVPWNAVIAALVLIAIIGGGVATWPDWKHLLAPQPAPVQAPMAQTPADDEVDSLRSELAQTRDRLLQLEARLSQPGTATGTAPLEQRLGQTETALRALQAQPQIPSKLVEDMDSLSKQTAELKRTSADAAVVLRLADRVEKVEAEMRALQSRRGSASAQLLAVGQLREALAKAMPYDAELRALKALAAQDPEIAAAAEVLKPRSVAGIPTVPTLTARFAALAPAIIRAQVMPQQQSWWRQTLDRAATLVTIRREDGAAAGDTPAAVVARAEAALAQGDLAAAAAELDGLQGGPADIAGNWLADAKARLAADKAVSELAAHVVAALGAQP